MASDAVVFPAAPVAETIGADWGRASCLWLVPGITAQKTRPEPAANRQDGRAYLQSAVVEDLRRWRPSIILVERDAPTRAGRSAQVANLPRRVAALSLARHGRRPRAVVPAQRRLAVTSAPRQRARLPAVREPLREMQVVERGRLPVDVDFVRRPAVVVGVAAVQCRRGIARHGGSSQ